MEEQKNFESVLAVTPWISYLSEPSDFVGDHWYGLGMAPRKQHAVVTTGDYYNFRRGDSHKPSFPT